MAELGQGPIYHMRHVNQNKHQQQWIAALEAKFEQRGPPFGRNEFEAFLGGFKVISLEADLNTGRPLLTGTKGCIGFSGSYFL